MGLPPNFNRTGFWREHGIPFLAISQNRILHVYSSGFVGAHVEVLHSKLTPIPNSPTLQFILLWKVIVYWTRRTLCKADTGYNELDTTVAMGQRVRAAGPRPHQQEMRERWADTLNKIPIPGMLTFPTLHKPEECL